MWKTIGIPVAVGVVSGGVGIMLGRTLFASSETKEAKAAVKKKQAA